MTDPLLSAKQAVEALSRHGILVHEKTLKNHAQRGEVPAEREVRPGTKHLKKAKWLFRKSALLAAFGALRVRNDSDRYHDILANGGSLEGSKC